jgi:hypothetical protein
MNAEAIEREFAVRAIPYSGGLLLFEAGVALELVERARREGIAVLGVNCLLVTQDSTIEPLEEMSDYSVAVSRGDGSWDSAAAHIAARRKSPFYFEVVLGDKIDPAV